MADHVADALAMLRALARPEELRAARDGTACSFKVNSHIHLPPNFSAFQTVEQALDLAHAQGVGVLGVSNYYDYTVYGDFVREARRRGIFPLFGLEIIALIDELVRNGTKINDPGNPGKIYVCGKGITRFAPFTPEAERLMGIIRHNDSARMRAMIEKLESVFDSRGLPTGLTEADVIDMVVRRHGSPRHTVYLQERHLCQAFQEAVFRLVPSEQRVAKLTSVLGLSGPATFGPDDAVKIQNEIRSYLLKSGRPAYVEETFINFEQARQLILELGGIPCYPVLADGASPMSPFEDSPQKLIENIKAMGFTCAEFIPIRNAPEVLSRYVRAMRDAGLVITAGTEHNTLDLLPIEPTCLKGKPIPDDVQAIFREGACVVAAHQHMVLHEQCGFVDLQGRLNPDYADADARIRTFAAMGGVLIRKYRETQASHERESQP